MTITHDGFRKLSRSISVVLRPPGTVNVTLEIATGSTAIKVTGEAPLFQAGDVSTTMNEKIGHVPNSGNDLTYFAQTSPGHWRWLPWECFYSGDAWHIQFVQSRSSAEIA